MRISLRFNENLMETDQIIIYQTKNGETAIDVKLENETIWLSQKQIAQLFGTKIPAINKHINNIVKSGELNLSTISKMEIVQKEGRRNIKKLVDIYSLDMVILGFNSEYPSLF